MNPGFRSWRPGFFMLWNRHGPADGRRMSGGWTVDGRRMTVDDGEWAADVCGRVCDWRRSVCAGRCRFCRGDAGLPRPCARGLPDKRMEKARLE